MCVCESFASEVGWSAPEVLESSAVKIQDRNVHTAKRFQKCTRSCCQQYTTRYSLSSIQGNWVSYVGTWISVSVFRNKNPEGDIFPISEAAVSSPTKALSSNCVSGGGSLAASCDLHFETFANVMTLGTRHVVKGTSRATRTRSLLLS